MIKCLFCLSHCTIIITTKHLSPVINLLFCLDRRLSFQPEPTAGTPGPTSAFTTTTTTAAAATAATK